MKKGSNPNDIHQEGQEQYKKLYRSISESARRLDDAHSCANNVGELFTPALQIQRSRFQEYCERLIFSDPILYGRKAEDILWRKAYYDVISSAKKLKKKEYTTEDVCNIQTHINAGVGHYHHFISRLQYQFNLDLKKFMDFAIFKSNLKKAGQKPDHIEWAKQSVHRSLIYLGDLNRYKLEIFPNWDPGLAMCYYLKAVHFNPNYGTPHNQMGTLASSQNRTLDSVYHYICCLSCKHPFEGTENNLLRLFEKNSSVLEECPVENRNADCIVQPDPADHIKRLIARFLVLTETWFFNRKLADIYILCHQTNVDLQECLAYLKPVASENGADTDSVEAESASLTYLTDDMVFKIIIICLLCITKLQKLQWNQISTAVAFTLAVYSQLLQIVTDHVSDTLLNITIPDTSVNHTNGTSKGKSKKQKTKARRRRKKAISDEESDVSDNEVGDDVDSNSEASGDDSETELVSSSSDNESEDDTANQNGSLNKKIDSKTDVENCENNSVNSTKSLSELVDKAKKIDPNTLIEIIAEEKLLISIRMLSDWFISDTDIVKSCGKSTRSLLKQIIQLLNLLNMDLENPKLSSKLDVQQIKTELLKIALPEDSALKGTEILAISQSSLDWDYIYNKSLTPKEETIIRISKLVAFGHSLAKMEETGISYDDKKKLFVIQSGDTEEVNNLDLVMGDTNVSEVDNDALTSNAKDGEKIENRKQLTKMKHMGQLWLAAEVRALENRVKNKTSLSPYLVVDADALIQSTPIIKHLINSKKFIVVVPSAVVSALDDLKKEKSEARDAIRWLELQFHHGNRFCRAQRPQERASLPLIKYPKKKDKEMFIYIQIIECCHYLAQQQKDATNLITLLLGKENALSNSENRELSFTGLARSAGINLEHVSDFYEKWRKNFKMKK